MRYQVWASNLNHDYDSELRDRPDVLVDMTADLEKARELRNKHTDAVTDVYIRDMVTDLVVV